jgi:hypothetical protein
MPRPSKQFSEKEIDLCCHFYARGATMLELANIMEVDLKTFKKYIPREKLLKAKTNKLLRLKEKAFEMAEDGDRHMLTFLLSQRTDMSEKKQEYKLKLQYEKELIDYKQRVGYIEHTSGNIEIYLNDANTNDKARNTIEVANSTQLGISDT